VLDQRRGRDRSDAKLARWECTARLVSDFLRSRDGAFPHERDGHRLGADAFGGPSRGRRARYSAPHDDANGVAGTVQPHGSLA